MTFNVNLKFQKWAKGFSGCNGGNLNGAIWFCGIEWGMGKDHEINKELTLSVSEPPQIYQTANDIVNYDNPQFGHKLKKLIAAMRLPGAYTTPFPFHRRSQFFQLNLFPIAFSGEDARRLWAEKYQAATGLPTTEAYLQWCRDNRFPNIRAWMEQGQPRLVVGMGIKYKDDFLNAFGSSGAMNEERVGGVGLWWTKANAGKSRLAIIPFLGFRQGSLNSDQLLQAFGERLGAILNDQESAASSRTSFLQPRATRKSVRIPVAFKTVAPVPAPICARGWGLDFSSREGSAAMRINCHLCDVPKTIPEICAGTANDRWGPMPVTEARAREHLNWHWDFNSGARPERRNSRTLVHGLMRDSQGRYYLPASMKPKVH